MIEDLIYADATKLADLIRRAAGAVAPVLSV